MLTDILLYIIIYGLVKKWEEEARTEGKDKQEHWTSSKDTQDCDYRYEDFEEIPLI